MMHFLYTILLWILAPLILSYHWYRSVSRGKNAALPERFGFLPGQVLQKLQDRDVIWVHAVSVGETVAVTPLVKELKRHWPNRKILLSNVTETGREVAGKLSDVDCCIYFPFDYPFAVSRLLNKIRPSLIIIVETEIWPNFIRAAGKMDIPVVMVNGRISDRSCRRYLRLKWFFQPVLRDISRFCMQTPEDARRIAAIGAVPERIQVTRNLKYDIALTTITPEGRNSLRTRYRIPSSATVLTAGSTHAGEEEEILSIYDQLQGSDGNCFLVLVPRHPERAAEVAAILKRVGLPFTLRSDLEKRNGLFKPGEVLLVDRVGELNTIYSFSDIVFVGGSLVPTGGHNVLEPASFGIPVLFGPSMQNFREIAALMLEHQAGIQVSDGRELQRIIEMLVDDPDRRSQIGASGLRMLQECRGATEAHMKVIRSVLEEGQEF